MEDNLKECDVVLRKMAQDALLFVLSKHEINLGKRKLHSEPEVVVAFINNLCVVVWLEYYHTESKWKDFFINHFKRMTTTPYLFANYVGYACYLSNKCIKDAFESCFVTLSIVIYFVLQCWEREHDEFFNSCIDLFCTFFKKEIRNKFEDQGGLQNFVEDLKSSRIMKKCDYLAQFQCQHLESEEPYAVDGVVLKDITETQVETHQEAVHFAESVVDTMEELCKKTFEEVLTDFEKTDRYVEEMPFLKMQTLGKASGDISKKWEQELFPKAQDEASENNSSVINCEEKELEIKVETTPDPLVAENSSSINFQDGFSDIKTSNLKQKLRKSERTKKLLSDLSMDIARISELIMFLCDKNGIGVPIHVVDTNNNP